MARTKNINTGLLLLRLTVGGLLLLHGLRKVEKPKKSMKNISNILEKNNLPAKMSKGAYAGEVIAPIALIAGYKTKLFAPVIVFNMLMAIYTAHMDHIDKRKESGAWELESPAFYLLGGLILSLTGAGKYALSSNNKCD